MDPLKCRWVIALGVRCDGGVVGGEVRDGLERCTWMLCCAGSDYQIAAGSECTVHCYVVQPSIAWYSTAWHCAVIQAIRRHNMALHAIVQQNAA